MFQLDATDKTIRRQTPAVERDSTNQASLVGWASGGLFVGIVAASTLAVRAHHLPHTIFAASAAKIAAGEIWLLPTSAFVVDRPVFIGLVAFGLLGCAALRICGTRVFWVAAGVGHIGSTLAVYTIIEAARLTDPDVFTSAVGRQDFGVSAMQGAWVGAVAATAWGWAGANPQARLRVATGVFALAGVAWLLHPDPSILTIEHLFAFLIGWSVASWRRLAAALRTAVGGAIVSPRRNATTTT